MNPERDTTRIVRSWLENGVTDLPDRVLDPVLDQLPSTPQRRHRWQARRSPRMNATLKIVSAAAAVVVVGVIGLNLLPGSALPGVGAVATASPSPSPTASASGGSGAVESVALRAGPLEAGRYHIDLELQDSSASADGTPTPGGVARVTFDIPNGWTGFEGWAINKAGAGTSGELALAPLTIESIFLDPCHWTGDAERRGASDWERGRTMNGLADGLWTSWASDTGPGYAARDGFAPTSPTATRPTEVSLAGLDARYLEVRTPPDVDLKACDGGQYTLWVDASGGQRYVHRAGELNRLWVVGVDGATVDARDRLLVLDAASHPDSAPADLAELQAIVDSVEIELLDAP